MKPLKLTIKGLQSFEEEQTIDFTALNNNLFLITGKTGSGKSTILDAIILSLYGKIPRNDNGESKNGLIDNLNKNSNDMSVSYTFMINEDILKIKRSYNYKEDRKEQFVSKKPILEINGNIVANQTTDISKHLKKYFNMSYSDFLKTVILVQNQFSDFIKLANKDKSNMLANIFDLKKYGDDFNKNIRQKIIIINEEIKTLNEYVLNTFEPSTLTLLENEIIKIKELITDKQIKIDYNATLISKYEQVIENNINYEKHNENIKKLLLNKDEIKDLKTKLKTYNNLKVLFLKHDNLNTAINQQTENENKIIQLTSELNDYKQNETEVSKKITTLKNNINELNNKINRLEFNPEQESLLNSEITKLKYNIQEQLKIKDECDRLNKLLTKHTENINHYKTSNDTLLNKKEKFEQIVEQNKAAHIANNLNENEPCPVCGSTDHPKLAHFIDEYEEDILTNMNNEISELNFKIASSTTIINESNNKLKELSYESNKISLLEIKLKDKKEKYKSILETKINFENLSSALSSKNNELLKLENTLSNIQISIQNTTQNIKNIEEQQLQNNKIVNDLNNEIYFELKQNNLDTISQLLELKIDASQIEILQTKIDTYDNELHKSNVIVEQLQNSIDFKITSEYIEDEKQNTMQLRRELESITNILFKLQQLYEQESSKQENSIEVLNKLEILNNKLRNLELLQNVFKSNTFVEYLASHKLKNIIYNASKRLSNITNGQYEIALVNKIQFELIDNLNDGKTRSTTTLSGGETFIVSLCLALSLSNELQINSKFPIEFFFLDEGFGALDPTTLEKVLTTLYTLQKQEGLTLGIISHVDYLKENINLKVEVTKPNDDHGSLIKINRT